MWTVVRMEANLFALVDADDEFAVFAHGMEIVDEERTDVVVFRRDPDTRRTMFGTHDSAERALKHYNRMMPLELVWLGSE